MPQANPINLNTAVKITALLRANPQRQSSEQFSTWALEISTEQTPKWIKIDRMTTFKFPTNQSNSNKWNSHSTVLSSATFIHWKLFNRGAEETHHTESLIVPRSSYAHSWATLIICSMCLNNSSAFFTWQAGSHRPMGRSSTHTHTHTPRASSLRLTARTGEVLSRPRLTLFRWTILLLSANHDPVTYRPNINNSGSISPPVPLEIQTGLCLPHCYTRPMGLTRSVAALKPWLAWSHQSLQAWHEYW